MRFLIIPFLFIGILLLAYACGQPSYSRVIAPWDQEEKDEKPLSKKRKSRIDRSRPPYIPPSEAETENEFSEEITTTRPKKLVINAYTPELGTFTGDGRHDDFFFVNADTGFIVNANGQFHKTVDGGNNWEKRFEFSNSYFRCVAFVDAQTGWIGTIGPDDPKLPSKSSQSLLSTTDGGETWYAVSNIDGPYPKGLCAMHVVNDSVVVAAGRVRGPAYFLITTNRGKSWTSYDLNHLSGGFMDVYFTTPQHGFLFGGTAPDDISKSRTQILKTNDGGKTWKTIYTGTQKGEWCWKVSFPSLEVGYVSVQRGSRKGKFVFLKTLDGGKTWKEHKFCEHAYFSQGIGFVTDSIGWIGGGVNYTYETTDGGNTWRKKDFGRKLNKFRFDSDSTGYATGLTKHRIKIRKEYQ